MTGSVLWITSVLENSPTSFGEKITLSSTNPNGGTVNDSVKKVENASRGRSTPHTVSSENPKFEMRIDASDGLLRHMVFSAKIQGYEDLEFSMELTLKNVVVNPEVDLAKFEYSVPEGIEPHDVTREVIAEITGEPLEDEAAREANEPLEY